MPSFQISITPSRRAAGRFIAKVRRSIQKALADEEAKGNDGIRQADIARAIGVNRSVIHREIRGHKDLTLGRVAELAWALGYEPDFVLRRIELEQGCNAATDTPGANPFIEVEQATTSSRFYRSHESHLDLAAVDG